jgi:hypothetical protein
LKEEAIMIQTRTGKPSGGKTERPRSSASAASTREASNAPKKLSLSPQERHRMICEAAYYRALRRGFRNGSPDQDWREAEAEIDAILIRARRS